MNVNFAVSKIVFIFALAKKTTVVIESEICRLFFSDLMACSSIG